MTLGVSLPHLWALSLLRGSLALLAELNYP